MTNKYNETINLTNYLNQDKFYYAEKCAILVLPHADDELFECGSLLLNYHNEIYLFITHSDDTIYDKNKWLTQLDMFKTCIQRINEYRQAKNYKPIFPLVFNGSDFNGMANEARKYVHSQIEDLLDKVSIVDYYATTVKSTHQSHCECNDIALSMMRSPFIEKCNNILLGTYSQSAYGLSYSCDYDNTNTYIPMTLEQVDFICDLIGNTYGDKNPMGSLLGMDLLKDYFKFYGNCIAEQYAQPFITLRQKILLN